MSETPPPTLLVDIDDGVACVTLNRPDKRNAIDREMGGALDEAFAHLAEDASVRVVVLGAAGPAFCAGADLKDARPADVASVLRGSARRITAPLDDFPKPVIAAVNGPAYGGGCELVLAADMRIASTAASFCLPELRIGTLPGSGGTQRLVAAVGSAVAAKMLFTGEPLDADEALRVGLVSDVCEPESLLAEAQSLARRVAASAPLSLLAAKQALSASAAPAGAQLERALWSLLATTKDRAEGRAAFRERRPPNFTGE